MAARHGVLVFDIRIRMYSNTNFTSFVFEYFGDWDIIRIHCEVFTPRLMAAIVVPFAAVTNTNVTTSNSSLVFIILLLSVIIHSIIINSIHIFFYILYSTVPNTIRTIDLNCTPASVRARTSCA